MNEGLRHFFALIGLCAIVAIIVAGLVARSRARKTGRDSSLKGVDLLSARRRAPDEPRPNGAPGHEPGSAS